ncbi:cytochrome P450 [Xylariaceae sp. FL1019]|nr:cytochrome P450 [Xylariaceae sp. FL1019]
MAFTGYAMFELGDVALPVVLGILLHYLVHAWCYRSHLNLIPGPFPAKFTSLWKFYVSWKEIMPFTSVDLHEELGPLVRIGPNHISASSAESLALIHRSRSGFIKSPMYDLLLPSFEGEILHNLFSTQDSGIHAALKRKIAPLYTKKALSSLEFHIDDCIAHFMSAMEIMIRRPENKPIDLGTWLQYYAFDCIGTVNFSRKMGYLETGQDVDGLCNLEQKKMLEFGTWGQVVPFVKVWMKIRAFFKGPGDQNAFFQTALDVVQDRIKHPTEGSDQLNRFLNLHQSDPNEFTVGHVIGATFITLVTSHEVVSTALRAVVYYLAKDAKRQERVQNEISEAVRNGKLSNPAQYSETQGLPYLSVFEIIGFPVLFPFSNFRGRSIPHQSVNITNCLSLATITEALRIHPATGLLLERVVPKGGATLHGYFLPEDTLIGVNPWVINRDKGIFGEDAHQFRPERWIESPPTNLVKMRTNLFSFGAGSRNCIGKNLALMEVNKAVAEIYRHYNVSLADPEMSWKVSGHWMTRQWDMDVILTTRG